VLSVAGVCYHGLGYHEKAAKAYYDTISVPGSQSLAGQEVILFQYLAVYQDLMAKYMRLMIDVPMRDFCFDRDFSAELKVSMQESKSEEWLGSNVACRSHPSSLPDSIFFGWANHRHSS
jgi:hypothetical protein